VLCCANLTDLADPECSNVFSTTTFHTIAVRLIHSELEVPTVVFVSYVNAVVSLSQTFKLGSCFRLLFTPCLYLDCPDFWKKLTATFLKVKVDPYATENFLPNHQSFFHQLMQSE